MWGGSPLVTLRFNNFLGFVSLFLGSRTFPRCPLMMLPGSQSRHSTSTPTLWASLSTPPSTDLAHAALPMAAGGDRCALQGGEKLHLQPQPFVPCLMCAGSAISLFSSRIARFSNVHDLSMYFPKNFGAETTKIFYIGLKGEWTEVRAKTSRTALLVYKEL